ncbi:MAG: hypothetical protein LBK53_01980 [Heliobacteriaceae bacterium]|jgi:hypothetical protein|nr:hypothetical protein [Heliobacteriaceae bacterium]
MADTVPINNIYGMYPNWYQNQVAFDDMYNDYTVNPAMSMNGSLFGMPFMPGFTGAMDPASYMRQYRDYNHAMVENQVALQQDQRLADINLNGPQEGVRGRAALLHDKILQDEQEQIVPAFKDYIASVKNLYPNADEKAVFSRAMTMYAQQYGKSFLEDIREHSDSSFVQGLYQAISFGFGADNRTAEENIAELTGQPVSRGENAKKGLGRVVGGATLGSVLGLGGIKLFKSLGLITKSKTVAGLVIGAIIGGVSMLIGSSGHSGS